MMKSNLERVLDVLQNITTGIFFGVGFVILSAVVVGIVYCFYLGFHQCFFPTLAALVVFLFGSYVGFRISRRY